ncbi:MAG: septal ring lytic transglycosylase RlpA family protein [Thiotrichales bacterium]|nr:septal ring lytic transglycosylase RlpA family protein [Thiotrichales bacterium]
MPLKKAAAYAVVFGALVFVYGCGGVGIYREEVDAAPDQPPDVSSVPDAVPRDEPKSKYGNPESYEVFGKRYYVMDSSAGYKQRGIASWYGTKFHGRRTSSGETYDMYKMTAAHKTLPLPTYVEVTNLDNGRRIIVRVNDRGPFHDGRIIDLSYTAATKLDIVKKGTGNVEVRALSSNTAGTATARKPVPPAKKKPTGQEAIYIQVGAFSDRANASALKDRLSALSTHLITIRHVVVQGRALYRVLVGPIFHIDIADRVVATLNQLGVGNHKIVTN